MAGFITQVRRVCCSVTLDVALSQEAPCLLRVAAVFYSMGAMEGARTLVEEARQWSFMHGVREVWDSLNECKPAFFSVERNWKLCPYSLSLFCCFASIWHIWPCATLQLFGACVVQAVAGFSSLGDQALNDTHFGSLFSFALFDFVWPDQKLEGFSTWGLFWAWEGNTFVVWRVPG